MDPAPVNPVGDPGDPWHPLSVAAVVELFGGVEFPWWISGGWAIDLFIGRQTRAHADTDVGMLRSDQLAVFNTLAGWELFATDPPGHLRWWAPGTKLGETVQGAWCRRGQGPWLLQLLLNGGTADEFVFRRDPTVRLPMDEAVLLSETGVPFLAPHIQLLFKAKYLRPKDEADITAALPLMDEAAVRWLRQGLVRVHPGHPWIDRIDGGRVDAIL